MLILRTEVDKKVNDLLMREVKTMLDWESVPHEEFESIEDKRLKHCPTDILTKCPPHYFSNEIKMDILIRIARGMKRGQYHTIYKNSEKLRDLLIGWFGNDFLKNNLQTIMYIIDTYAAKSVISSLNLALVTKGLIKFTDVNIELNHIYQNYYIVVPEVKQETWIDLCNNTNYLQEMYLYEGGLSYSQALPLYNEQLKIVGLYEIKNHSLESFRTFSEDSDYYFNQLKKYNSDNTLEWDNLVSLFYSGEIGIETLDEYWKFALNEQKVDEIVHDFKKEACPKEWTRLDL